MRNESAATVDRIAKKLGGLTDYKVSKALGVTQQAVHNWRAGTHRMSDATALKAAALLGETPEPLLVRLAAERSKNGAATKVLEALARRLQRSAATVAVLIVGVGALFASPASTSPQMYIMSIRRRFGFVLPSTTVPAAA